MQILKIISMEIKAEHIDRYKIGADPRPVVKFSGFDNVSDVVDNLPGYNPCKINKKSVLYITDGYDSSKNRVMTFQNHIRDAGRQDITVKFVE